MTAYMLSDRSRENYKHYLIKAQSNNQIYMNFKHLLLAIFAAGALSAAAEEPADGLATQGGIEADTT